MVRCSIVIPVHGRSSLTRQCLRTLLAAPPEVDAEIVVVDDASRDDTRERLVEFEDRIRVVGRAARGGFACACNDGARTSTAELLVFLNNDTLPRPGWLDALVREHDADPRTAVVGAKLLYPNETVQHAGVVVCQDRYPRHLYAGFPADHPAVNRSRRFRMVTGACMLVRRSAFDEVGGFDETFVNAYEDQDLCLRIGERGHHVRYCAESVLVHLTGATRSRLRDELEHATRRFRIRWGGRLEPDDVAYYVEDGLLRVEYGEGYPVRLAVDPLLATLDESARGGAVERLLAARSRQVYELLRREAERPLPAEVEAPPLKGAGEGGPRPPSRLAHWVGASDFERTGEEFLTYLIELAGLAPGDRVLDVGCGVGRMAIPLTRYLSAEGSYEGFDVMAEPIAWCRENLSARFPRFRFRHVDVKSGFYNRNGRDEAVALRFPYDDASFDVVFLTSVFTHLLPAARDHYLGEISRVLRPGGACLATFFLLNPESLALVRAGLSSGLPFPHREEGCRLHDAAVPETAVAHDEDAVLGAYRAAGLTISPPVRYGTWCGRLDGLSYQDILVATREGT